jgi:outer membrane protein assembly factor BamB
MRTPALFRHAFVTLAAAAALAGLTTMADSAGAIARTMPAAHRAADRQRTTGFANWPMFRGDLTHTGVSPETGINTTTASTLTPGWSASLGTASYSSPAVVDLKSLGEPVVFGGGSSLSAYEASTGALLWSFPVAKPVNSSPAVLNGVVYFASTDGTVYAVNAKNGVLRCSFATGQFTETSPAVVEDPDGSGPVIYLGTSPPLPDEGSEYAIYGPGNTHGSCTQDWAFSGWTIHPGGSWSPPAYGTNANGTPVLVFGSENIDNSVYALNAKTGAKIWTYRTSKTTEDNDVGASPTISAPGVNGFADRLAYVTSKDKVTYALDLTTGKLVWQHALDTDKSADVGGSALAGNTVYVDASTGVYALDATTGAQVWHVLPKAGFYASPAVAGPPGQQVLITASLPGRLYAFDLANGNTVWMHEADGAGIWSSPAVSQNTIYITGRDGQLVTFAPSARHTVVSLSLIRAGVRFRGSEPVCRPMPAPRAAARSATSWFAKPRSFPGAIWYDSRRMGRPDVCGE